MSAICMPRLRPAGRAAGKRERKKGRGGKREKESERERRRGTDTASHCSSLRSPENPQTRWKPQKAAGQRDKGAAWGGGGHERARHVHQASHTVASTASLLPLFPSPSLYHSIFDQSMQFCINCRINYTD